MLKKLNSVLWFYTTPFRVINTKVILAYSCFIVICDRICEKGPYRANNDFSRRFSATTPKNNSRDKTFVFVSEVSPTLCLHSR